MQYAPRTLQDAFERALALEAGLQLADGVHLWKVPSGDVDLHYCAPATLMVSKVVHIKSMLEIAWHRSNACWKCGGLGHFQKDCKATVNPQGGDRDDAALSDTNPTIGQMSHTLTSSMPITSLTFKTILKELVSSVIGNRRAFHPKPQTIPKTPIQPSAGGVNLTVTHVVTAVASTSSPQTHPYLLHLLLVQEIPHIQLIPVEVLLRLGVKQQCLKVPGLRLIDFSLVRW